MANVRIKNKRGDLEKKKILAKNTRKKQNRYKIKMAGRGREKSV